MKIECPVSIGEICDKFTILQIKAEKITNEDLKETVEKEKKYLEDILINHDIFAALSNEMKDLKKINLELWGLEDSIREFEKKACFGLRFIEVARRIYQTNDIRFKIKKAINEKMGSEIKEVKSYGEKGVPDGKSN